MTALPSPQDMDAIEQLYSRYSWALDTGDTEGYIALFTQDAELTEEARGGGTERKHGHEGVRELVLKFHEDPEFPGRQHRMSQLVVDPDPQGRPDHWQVRAYVTTTQNRPPEPPALYWCGHVLDTVAKVDGRWLFQAKSIMAWTGDVLSRFTA
jgi:SnoaL-like protein